jgi:hypothetical protein
MIVFSNHGGRQVDTAPPAIECLEDIVNVVDGRVEGKFHLMRIFDFFLILIFFYKILLLKWTLYC